VWEISTIIIFGDYKNSANNKDWQIIKKMNWDVFIHHPATANPVANCKRLDSCGTFPRNHFLGKHNQSHCTTSECNVSLCMWDQRFSNKTFLDKFQPPTHCRTLWFKRLSACGTRGLWGNYSSVLEQSWICTIPINFW